MERCLGFPGLSEPGEAAKGREEQRPAPVPPISILFPTPKSRLDGGTRLMMVWCAHARTNLAFLAAFLFFKT
jgi:hypothetical protein